MLLVLLLPAFVLWEFRGVYGVQETKFYSGILCDLDSRLMSECSKPVANFLTFKACVFGCSLDSECVGASVVNTSTCFHHRTCSSSGSTAAALSVCTRKEDTHKYVSKNCAHGGVWNPVTSTCTCAKGWVGEHCLDLPTKCLDLVDLGGYSDGGEHRVYLDLLENDWTLPDRQPVPAICALAPNSRYSNIPIFSNFGNGNFGNRSWDEYKNGIFVDHSNYWIGLKTWHALSMAGYKTLSVYLTIGNTFRIYRGFHVADEAHHFAFTFSDTSQEYRTGSMTNTFPNCLEGLDNSPFSTRDNDHDGDSSQNCARRVGSGWWFSGGSCISRCNLLGASVHDWGQVPSDQVMRLDGVDAGLMRLHDRVGMRAYVQKY